MLEVKPDGSISLTRGDTGIFNLALVDSDGNQYVPHEGDRIVFSMAKAPGDEVILQKDVDMGTMQLRLDPEDTKSLDFATYSYDLQLTDYLDNVTTVLLSKIKFTKEVG